MQRAGFVRCFMPKLVPIVRAYEALTGRDFPKLKPRPLWYHQPVYYMGNHLAFVTDGADVAIPSYTRALDYELELGFVILTASSMPAPKTARVLSAASLC